MKKLFLAIALIIATASMSVNAIEIICISPNSVATTDWGRNIEKKANEALKKGYKKEYLIKSFGCVLLTLLSCLFRQYQYPICSFRVCFGAE